MQVSYGSSLVNSFGRITLYAMFVVTVVTVASRVNYYHKTTFLSVNSCLLVSAIAPPTNFTYKIS